MLWFFVEKRRYVDATSEIEGDLERGRTQLVPSSARVSYSSGVPISCHLQGSLCLLQPRRVNPTDSFWRFQILFVCPIRFVQPGAFFTRQMITAVAPPSDQPLRYKWLWLFATPSHPNALWWLSRCWHIFKFRVSIRLKVKFDYNRLDWIRLNVLLTRLISGVYMHLYVEGK